MALTEGIVAISQLSSLAGTIVKAWQVLSQKNEHRLDREWLLLLQEELYKHERSLAQIREQKPTAALISIPPDSPVALNTTDPLFIRLQLEAETLAATYGFDVVYERLSEGGYGLALPLGDNYIFCFLLSDAYPHQEPTVLVKAGDELQQISFESGVWSPDFTIADLVREIAPAYLTEKQGTAMFPSSHSTPPISSIDTQMSSNFPPINLKSPMVSPTRDETIHIRITEEPLTAQNLMTILTALTELSTKYWLIAKGRYADLIEYTQTHNGRFAEEAQIIVTKITYNSPMNIDWKVDLSAPSVAEALITTIDGITQVRKRFEQAELENLAKAQALKYAEQQADYERQMASLEKERQQLEIEQRRLEVLEKRLEVQRKGIEYALEIAGKVVDTLHPRADPATRAMEIQTLLPNLIQLQNGRGLELALPAQQNRKEEQ